jgi:hypothetical protein
MRGTWMERIMVVTNEMKLPINRRLYRYGCLAVTEGLDGFCPPPDNPAAGAGTPRRHGSKLLYIKRSGFVLSRQPTGVGAAVAGRRHVRRQPGHGRRVRGTGQQFQGVGGVQVLERLQRGGEVVLQRVPQPLDVPDGPGAAVSSSRSDTANPPPTFSWSGSNDAQSSGTLSTNTTKQCRRQVMVR